MLRYKLFNNYNNMLDLKSFIKGFDIHHRSVKYGLPNSKQTVFYPRYVQIRETKTKPKDCSPLITMSSNFELNVELMA